MINMFKKLGFIAIAVLSISVAQAAYVPPGSVDLGTAVKSGTILPSTSAPALTGDVHSQSGSLTTTIQPGAVTNSKMANMPASTLKGNNTGSAAAVLDLSPTQVKTLLNITAADVAAGPLVSSVHGNDLLHMHQASDDTERTVLASSLKRYISAGAWIDPTDPAYGATCGGANWSTGMPVSIDGHDDTAGIRAALLDARATGYPVIAPNGCFINGLQLVSGVTISSMSDAVNYGYDLDTNNKPFAGPVWYCSAHPTNCIDLNGAETVAIKGIEINAKADSLAATSTACIGSTKKSDGFGGKVFLDSVSIKGCKYAFRPKNGLVFTTVYNSDLSGNDVGIAGSVSDLAVYNTTFTSGSIGIWLEGAGTAGTNNGALVNVTGGRMEYLAQGIVGDFVNELNLNGVIMDHFQKGAITLNGAFQHFSMTGGVVKAGGTSGSLTVTSVADNGSGAARLTVTSANPDFYGSSVLGGVSTGDTITIAGATPSDLNGVWTVTKIDATHLDLQASTYSGPYTGSIYGGVWGKDADIVLNGSTGARNVSFTGVGFASSSAIGAPPAPAYIIDTTTGNNNNISFNGGVLQSIAQSYAINYNSYSMGIANWETFGQPSHYSVNVAGNAYFSTEPMYLQNTGIVYAAGAKGAVDPAWSIDSGGASAVNGLRALGANAGNAPEFVAVGPDTNIGIVYRPKGTGNQLFKVNNIDKLVLGPTSSTSYSPFGISSNAFNCFVVGPNGFTYPGFQIDCSAANAVTGWKGVMKAAGGGAYMVVSSTGANESGGIYSAGTGSLYLGVAGGTNVATVSATGVVSTGKVTGNLADSTGLPLTTGVTGILPVANGGTNASTPAGARTSLGFRATEYCYAISDYNTTLITPATGVATEYLPAAFTVTGVRAYTRTAPPGLMTIDINEAGTTILSTKLTIDANEKSSGTAATAAVISDTSIAANAEITVDVDSTTGGKGGVVCIEGTF